MCVCVGGGGGERVESEGQMYLSEISTVGQTSTCKISTGERRQTSIPEISSRGCKCPGCIFNLEWEGGGGANVR